MFNLPNCISLVRLPLALLFLHQNTAFRCLIIVLAGLSDFFDGYIARKYQLKTRLGTALDPIMDKFFVIFVLSILYKEYYIDLIDIPIMISRDIAVLLFGGYLAMTGNLHAYKFRSIWSGKISTTLQFAVLMVIILQIPIPTFVWGTFILLGICALFELYLTKEKVIV